MCVSDCFFKQGDWCFALADYQQAEDMMGPDDPAARLRLAVLHNTLGSFCFQNGSGEHIFTTHEDNSFSFRCFICECLHFQVLPRGS